MRREAVSERMTTCILRDPRLANRPFDGLLNGGFRQVMSSLFSAPGIDRAMHRRKDILPAPLFWCVGIFPRQSVRQKNFAITSPQIFFMQHFYLLQMTPERLL